MPTSSRDGRRPPVLVRIVRVRPRLFTCAAIGVVVSAVLVFVPNSRPVPRMLAGWDIGVALYLALVFEMMRRSDIDSIRRRAAEQDEGQFAILGLTVAAALVSLAAIFVELGGVARENRQPASLVLVVLTILISWALIHTIFALHYAHEFYDDTDGGGLAFPGGDREPDYWDFVYFSFVIGMTSQVSDVGVSSKEIRRTVAAHGVVAFIFNTAVLALTISLVGSAIQSKAS